MRALPGVRAPSGVVASRRPNTSIVMACDVDLGIPDGACVHTVEVARAFANEGLRVDLVARGPDPRVDGVRYHPAHGYETERGLRALSLTVRTIGLLWRRRRATDRFYVRHKWTTMPATLAARAMGYRVVAQVDGIPYGSTFAGRVNPLVDYSKRSLTILMCRLVHAIVAVSPEVKARLVEEFHARPESVAVLHNGADVDLFQPLDRDEAIARAGLEPGCRYAVFVGAFSPWVDFDTLLGAFSLIAESRPDARLLLVGDGVMTPDIESMTRRLGLTDRVTITGYVRDRAEVRDLICASTVSIIVIRTDHVARTGVSVVKLGEYLACGRAVVATELPGLRDALIETGAGTVVPSDPRSLADALIPLLDPAVADPLGVIGRRLAVERYSWRSTVRGTLPLFDAQPARGR